MLYSCVEEKLGNENWQIKSLTVERCDTFLKTREVKSRFIEPFRIIARIGNVAYRLELPEELNGIHDTFHVSYLRKCLADESAYVPLEDLEIDDKLNYVESR
ncbi:hypothetical protein E3N88_17153 [Mikania micrantha]|uniref:Tf2-1-like SH3-like domain-containing protein n=1 Tax=Mikania micrantha TaxID=192012 RepID=A0A5N6NU19_9ASTR|nr:hypothetical protein E3N88_17153 [Mikania micrantha]